MPYFWMEKKAFQPVEISREQALEYIEATEVDHGKLIHGLERGEFIGIGNDIFYRVSEKQKGEMPNAKLKNPKATEHY